MTEPAPSSPGRFDGRVAIVTGGGSLSDVVGIGAAIAHVLARRGAVVAVVDRDRVAAERTIASVAAEGGHAHAVVGDATDDADRARFLAEAAALGDVRVLVNNLGITSPPRAAATADPWAFVMRVNLDAAFDLTRRCAAAMRGGGSIVNVSSTSAVVAIRGNDRRPADRVDLEAAAGAFRPAYAASKGGIEALTRSTAAHFGRYGIRANCVRPGEVWTHLVASARDPEAAQVWREERRLRSALQTEGTAWDVAHAVAFLAGDEARWITGQVLTVDGGMGVIR